MELTGGLFMRVNAINTAYHQPKVRKTLKNNSTVAAPNTEVNFQGKHTGKLIGGGVMGLIGGAIGLLAGGPLGALIGASIGGGTGVGYGAIDDENQATGDNINPLEGWERDTKF